MQFWLPLLPSEGIYWKMLTVLLLSSYLVPKSFISLCSRWVSLRCDSLWARGCGGGSESYNKKPWYFYLLFLFHSVTQEFVDGSIGPGPLKRDWVMNIFWRSIKLKQYLLSVHAQMDFKFEGCLVREKKTIIKFLLASLKTFTNSKDFTESRISISVPAFLVDFRPCTVIAGLHKSFQNHGRLSEQL